MVRASRSRNASNGRYHSRSQWVCGTTVHAKSVGARGTTRELTGHRGYQRAVRRPAGTKPPASRRLATGRGSDVFRRTMDNDAALATRLARDVDGAFPELVADHQARLYTIALRLLGDRRDAEEVAQDALVRAYRAIGGYPSERVSALRLRPWLASIAVNLARNRRRRLDDRQPPGSLEPMLDAGFDPPAEGRAAPEATAARREARVGPAGALPEP